MKFTFESFKQIEELSKFKIIILTSNRSDFFKSKVKHALADMFDKPNRVDVSARSPKDIVDLLKYNPLFGERWFVEVNQAVMSSKNLDALFHDYFSKPFDNTLMILDSDDKKYNQILQRSKVVLRSREIAWVDLSYPRYAVVTDYIVKYFTSTNYSIDDYAIRTIIKRLGSHFEEMDSSLKQLELYCKTSCKVHSTDVVTIVEDHEEYGVRDLFTSIVKLDKVTIPMKALHSLLDEYGPRYVRKSLGNSIEHLRQAKDLVRKGYTKHGSIKKFDFDFMNNRLGAEYKKMYNILWLPESTLNYYLELSTLIPSYDLSLLSIIYGRYECVDDAEVLEMVLSMLARRTLTEDMLLRVYATNKDELNSDEVYLHSECRPVLKVIESKEGKESRKVKKKKKTKTKSTGKAIAKRSVFDVKQN